MKLTRFVTAFWAITLLYGCSSGGDGTGSVDDRTIQAFSVDCSGSAIYDPLKSPLITDATVGPATTTVIFMHWKIGSPVAPELVSIFTALADAGYDVIAPYMPWNTSIWDGSMCEAINYIDDLAAKEADKGKDVIIAGHGMGATHALIIGVAAPGSEVKGIVAIAPGHFPHLFTKRQADIAQFIATAEDMVASGNGDDPPETFDSYTISMPISITATANNYLSYHALDQFPNILDVVSSTILPVLCLAGDNDPITSNFQT